MPAGCCPAGRRSTWPPARLRSSPPPRATGPRALVLPAPLAPGLAVQVAEPLTSTDQEVTAIGATLAALSALGVLLAAVGGWAVARTGLTPVARLAGVAEEVSLTGDP